jgi:hypothetical protein
MINIRLENISPTENIFAKALNAFQWSFSYSAGSFIFYAYNV